MLTGLTSLPTMRCNAPTEQPITIIPEGGSMCGEGIKGAGVQESEAEGRRKQVCEEAESLGDRQPHPKPHQTPLTLPEEATRVPHKFAQLKLN